MSVEWKQQHQLEREGDFTSVYFGDNDEGLRLARTVIYNGFGHFPATYGVGRQDERLIPTPELIEGRIAYSPVLDHRDSTFASVQANPQQRAEKLAKLYDLIGPYINDFAACPTSTEQEIATFRGIEGCIDRLRAGESTPEDMKFFWGYVERL